MTDTTYQNGGSQRVVRGMLVAGGLIGAWAFTALMFALSKFDWQVGELFRQYLVSVGLIQDFETLVDFYTHIKGIEYLICLAFLGTFPAYFRFLNRERKTAS